MPLQVENWLALTLFRFRAARFGRRSVVIRSADLKSLHKVPPDPAFTGNLAPLVSATLNIGINVATVECTDFVTAAPRTVIEIHIGRDFELRLRDGSLLVTLNPGLTCGFRRRFELSLACGLGRRLRLNLRGLRIGCRLGSGLCIGGSLGCGSDNCVCRSLLDLASQRRHWRSLLAAKSFRPPYDTRLTKITDVWRDTHIP